MKFQKPWEQGSLRVAENGRYFYNGEIPFFWYGDTAWQLFHKLTLEESYCYLRNRKELGFNVIFAVLVQDLGQQNIHGDYALVEDDFTRPAEGGFWEHIDKVIQMAEELGLYMGILPVWGNFMVKRGFLNMDNLDQYMNFLFRRYEKAQNLIWIVGGDVRGDIHPEVFCKMGELMKQDNPERLVGYHPFGRTASSLWFHEEKWLDFNMFQSGHRRYDQVQLNAWDDNAKAEGIFGEDSWRYVERDYNRELIKPVFDGEPSYEWIVQGLHDFTQPYWQAADVRRYAYWDVFAGAAGHTYGHNSIIQFYSDLSEMGAYGAKYHWKDAIHHPGAAQISYLKKLMESVDFTHGRPAQEYLLSEQGERYDYISVFAGEDYLFAYTFTGREISVSLEAYAGKEMSAYWMDPVTGARTFICDVTGLDSVTLLPPEREDGSDAVLIIR